jgi:uncharacterized membrane protein (UPF0127 family)
MRQMVRVSIESSRNGGWVVCDRCRVADSPPARMLGLLGRRALDPGEGLMITRAFAIHTLFMSFAIDAVFLDARFSVIGVRSRLRPWRATAVRGAAAVLELGAGEAERRGVTVGQRLRLDPMRGLR